MDRKEVKERLLGWEGHPPLSLLLSWCCCGVPACLLAFSPDLLGRQELLNISFEAREFLPTNCRSRWLQPSLPSPLLGEKTRYWYASPFLVFLLTLR